MYYLHRHLLRTIRDNPRKEGVSRQYRAVWRDRAEDLFRNGKSAVQDWMEEKGADLRLPEAGVKKTKTHEVGVDHVVDKSDPNLEALRIRFTELRHIGGSEERWITTALWITHGSEGWVWVDLEWVADDISANRQVFAPGLVRRLLELRQPYSVQDHLGPRLIKVKTEGDVDLLFERLFLETRSAPLVLFSVDDRISQYKTEQRARLVAKRLAGCADVRMLTASTQDRFHEQIDAIDLSVFGGAVRIYLPIPDRYDPQPWKHRYIHRRYLPDDRRFAADRVVGQVLRRTIAQNPPPIYLSHVRSLFAAQNRDWEEFALDLDEDNQALRATAERLQRKNADLQDDRDMAMEEAAESERVAHNLARKVEYLRQELRSLRVIPDAFEQEIHQRPAPDSCQEAVEEARHLSLVEVHPNAPKEIARLDSDEDSALWGKRIDRYLQALESYGKDKEEKRFEGNFKSWCDQSGSDNVINSRKFVALFESETVRNNKEYMRHRLFPIDKSVNPSGFIEMQAHLKVVQGGGMNIPRIYFYDDTHKTGKIFIGFIGPHDLVPNPSKN